MKQYSENELQPLLDHIQEVANIGSTVMAMDIKDALLMAEHIRDLEETIDALEEKA